MQFHLKKVWLFQRNVIYFQLNKMTTAAVEVDKVIVEGKSKIYVPDGLKVFYNPVQEFNRDLSVAVLRLLVSKSSNQVNENNVENKKKEFRVLEALSATGLRSIRYAKEISGITEIIANDISASAVKIIDENIQKNDVTGLVKTSHNDAMAVMFESRTPDRRFDAVDIDPYGCPSIFLDSAVQSVKDGGVLLVTCTDMAVLCGNTPNTCYVKYGAVSLRNKACHEMAIRIILQCIESHATRYKRYIVPLLSVSADFYVRVFVQIYTSALITKKTTSKLSMVYQCNGCQTLTLQPLGILKSSSGGKLLKNVKYALPPAPSVGGRCEHCGSSHHIGGPIWSAPIHDEKFVTELLDQVKESDLATHARIQGVLSVIREELTDVPLYYSIDRLFSTVHATSMSMLKFRSALLNAGYRVSLSHASPTSVKTDAPMYVLWDIVRAWTKEHPVSEKKMKENLVAKTILSTPLRTEIDFSFRSDANPLSREMKLVRYQENPAAYWGPGSRSVVNDAEIAKKSLKPMKKRKRRPDEDETLDGKACKSDPAK